jgi:acyl carrier protein
VNDEDIRHRTVGILRTIAPEVEEGELTGAEPLRNQVDLDSMDWLNFLVALHEQFKVDIPEADYAKLVTLDDLVAYLKKKLPPG